MEDCKIYNNYADRQGNLIAFFTYADLTMNDCQIYKNTVTDGVSLSIFNTDTLHAAADLTLTNCEIFDNKAEVIFHLTNTNFVLKNSRIYDNGGMVFYTPYLYPHGTISDCTFNNNGKELNYVSFAFEGSTGLKFSNCDFGDSTFSNKGNATYTNCTGAGIGSLFGAGSTTMLIAMGALVAVFVGASVVIVKKRRTAQAK